MSVNPRVAVVVPGLAEGGGVPAVARFIYRTLSTSNRFHPHYISLATSAHDTASVRLLSPRSWLRGPQVTDAHWDDGRYQHVGCHFAEFEFQRYRPRRVLTKLLRDYDLVQVVAGGPAAGWAATERDCPVCLFVATTSAHERPSILAKTAGLRRLWLKNMTRLTVQIEHQVLPRMSQVFAESEYTRQLVAPYVQADRLVLSPPGVDIELFHPASSLRADGHILSVSRLSDPRKNVRLLIDAYARLRQERPGAPRLVLAGASSPSLVNWERVRSLGLTDYIEVRVNPSLGELTALYRDATMFVLSSDEEGLGIVILEAMACGLPVVSTDCGGPATAVKDGQTGFLTPVGDAPALAMAMKKLLENPALQQQMGQAGRARAEQVFSLEAAGRVYLQKYDELLGKCAASTEF